MKPTDVRICSSTAETRYFKYRAPMKFGGRTVTEVVLLDVAVEVEPRVGRRGRGAGSMPMGNIWAWPSQKVAPEQTLAAMIELARRLTAAANDFNGVGHPMELTHQLESLHGSVANAVTQAAGLPEPMPPVAQLVAASPVEAALHDAYGKTLGRSSYDLLGAEFAAPADLSSYLTSEFAGEYLDQYTLRKPKPRMPLYHLVGAVDLLYRRRCHDANQRRPAGNAGRMDRRRRPHAFEDQARRR